MGFAYIAFSALALALLFGSPAARAWTIDGQSGNNSDGTARFADPDQDLDKLTEPGAGPTGTGNRAAPTVSFGIRRTDSPYSRTNPLASRRVEPPSAVHGDDSHLFWGNSRYR